MIKEKICPIMSRCEILPNGDHVLATVYCQEEQCMAWGRHMEMIYNDDGEGDWGSEIGCRLIP